MNQSNLVIIIIYMKNVGFYNIVWAVYA